MIETPMVESQTTEDLLTRIKRETHERLEELHPAVDENERLRAELRALEAQPEMEASNPERVAEVLSFPTRPSRTPLVSPKITRLMRSRQGLSVERTGPGLLDEVDVEVEHYERAS
jgi:hypothetical protein